MMWISKKRLYTTNDGQVVEEGHPEARFLLVAAGGELPEEVARRYGLLKVEGASLEEEKRRPRKKA